jgi:hypothetical protein
VELTRDEIQERLAGIDVQKYLEKAPKAVNTTRIALPLAVTMLVGVGVIGSLLIVLPKPSSGISPIYIVAGLFIVLTLALQPMVMSGIRRLSSELSIEVARALGLPIDFKYATLQSAITQGYRNHVMKNEAFDLAGIVALVYGVKAD